MKRHAGNGRTFYRILVTLLSCVFIMAGFNWALMTYQNRRSVEIHTDMLANAMENGADQIDGFFSGAGCSKVGPILKHMISFHRHPPITAPAWDVSCREECAAGHCGKSETAAHP